MTGPALQLDATGQIVTGADPSVKTIYISDDGQSLVAQVAPEPPPAGGVNPSDAFRLRILFPDTNLSLSDAMSIALLFPETNAALVDALSVGITFPEINAALLDAFLQLSIAIQESNISPTEALALRIAFSDSNLAPSETLRIAFTIADTNPALADALTKLAITFAESNAAPSDSSTFVLRPTFNEANGFVTKLPTAYNCKGWWKADAITGLADNANLVTWLDSSGASNTATADLEPPKYRTNVLDGKPVSRHTTAGGWRNRIRLANIPIVGTDNYAMFIVCNTTDITAGRIPFHPSQGGGTLIESSGQVVANHGKVVFSHPGVASAVDGNTPTGFAILAFRRRAGVNGLWVSGGSNLISSTAAPATPSAGAGFIGVGPAGGNYFIGDIAEVFTIEQALTDVDMDSLGRGLVEKYPSLTWTPLTNTAPVLNDSLSSLNLRIGETNVAPTDARSARALWQQGATTAAVTGTAWTNAANAQGQNNGDVATFNDPITSTVDTTLTFNPYPDPVTDLSAWTIAFVRVKFYINTTFSALTTASYIWEWSIDGTTWTAFTTFGVAGGNNLTTPVQRDITGARTWTWANINNFRTRLRYASTILAETATISVDSVELEVIADRTSF